MLPSGIYYYQLMHPRQDMIDLFSTFMQFEADCFSGWVTDLKLRRNMRSCLEHASEAPASEYSWALYWYEVWRVQSMSLAGKHLAAYLQEPCYWAAQRTVKRFTNTQYKLSDYFQIAIAEVDTVLEGFRPGKGSSLKNYARIALLSLLKDILRQRHEADICTNWALLRKLSKKRIEESLSHAGLSPTAIAQYRLAWTCFNALYVQKSTATSQLPKPNWQLWEAITNLYNTERHSQLSLSGPKCSPETMEKWLNNCAAWVRGYLYLPTDSLNAPQMGQESREIQDDLPDLLHESLLTEIIAQEDAQNRQAQQSQINTVLTTALWKLDSQSQLLLSLYYKQELTQQQIARQMEMSQVSVSRRLSRARESLLEALVQWSWKTLNISLTSNLVKDMSTTLEEWLRVHYDEPYLSPVIKLESLG